jgi:transposase InsO family protein
MEPVRQAILSQYGAVDKDIVKGTGLALRNDHGTQYDSHDFLREMRHFGLNLSPAFVRSPECNGIIERFHRTLQEQVFDVHVFKNLEEARAAIAKFIEDYNRYWLLERHGHRSPLEVRADLNQALLNAA